MMAEGELVIKCEIRWRTVEGWIDERSDNSSLHIVIAMHSSVAGGSLTPLTVTPTKRIGAYWRHYRLPSCILSICVSRPTFFADTGLCRYIDMSAKVCIVNNSHDISPWELEYNAAL